MRAIVRAIRRRIAFKLTLTLVGFVGVSMVAAGFFLNHALEEFAVESLEQRLASVAGVIEEEARGLLRGGGAPRRPRPSSCAWRVRRARASP